MLFLFLSMLLAFAAGIEDQFPTTPLPPAQQTARAAELLGPAARIYDGRTATPGAATDDERAVEAALGLKLAPAPDSLRRWGRFMLAMSAEGPVPDALAAFAAEHVGLPMDAEVMTRLVSGKGPAEIADMVRGMDPAGWEARSIAVVLAPIPGGVRGMVVACWGEVDFEPFPRVWQLGDVATVPGTLLSRGREYALFVGSRSRAEVSEFPIPGGDGVFDIDIPLPQEPGRWRVVLDVRRPEAFPESGFSLSLYVGEEPPTVPPPVPPASGDGAPEDQVIALLNAERARFGLRPLEAAGDRPRMEAFLAGMPAQERPRLRYVRQLGRSDPLPEAPHGGWRGFSALSLDPSGAASEFLDHPINRRAVLDPEAALAYVGSRVMEDGERYYLGLAFHRAAVGGEVRETVRGLLAARFHHPPADAARTSAALDAIAQRVASGDLAFKGAIPELQRMVKKGQQDRSYTGAVGMNAYIWAPGSPTTSFESFVPAAGANVLAVGVATGDLGRGDGLSYAVVLVLSAESMP